MSNYTGTPVLHHVFNELDRHGLLLGLPRLEGEPNAVYKQRLLDVMVHRANSSYMGLIYGITRELGLSITKALKIVPLKDSNGDFLVPYPAIVFEETKCYIYDDFSEKSIILTLDRFEEDGDAWTLSDLIIAINATGYFTATLLDESAAARAMTIFNQRSHNVVPYEDITGAGVVVKLKNRNIVPKSLVISSPNLTKLVSSQVNIRKRGDFYVDYQAGIIYSYAAPAPGDACRYEYILEEFIVKSSPVIIHNLQSDDFRTKMFEQIEDGEGNTINGLPTTLGADIINELLTVYPTSWGR